jgi:hypothetical protein
MTEKRGEQRRVGAVLEVEQGLEFIGFRPFWQGHLNRSNVMPPFGLSVNLASSHLSRHVGHAPRTIDCRCSLRPCARQPGLKPVLDKLGAGRDLSDTSGEESRSRVRLPWLVPMGRICGTADHAKAEAMRAMPALLWLLATPLPRMVATCAKTGPGTAEIRFAIMPDLPPMPVRLNAEGDMIKVRALRWGVANPGKSNRPQLLGGRMLDGAEFQRFRSPTRSKTGNPLGHGRSRALFRSRSCAGGPLTCPASHPDTEGGR